MKLQQTYRFYAFVFFLLGFVILGNNAYARASAINLGGSESTAVQGYDVMAYWNQGKALKGDANITLDYKNATWHFASEANRDAFAANPEKYAPQYGGYCAYAAGKGYLANVDVNAWTIYNEKLYLNYSKSVRALWSLDKAGYIASGDANWPKILEN